MNTKADWIVVVGFFLTVSGAVLRTVIMMRSSDARPANATPLVGGDLVRSFRVSKPDSWLPRLMWASLCTGLVLLIVGFLLEFR